MTLGVGFVIIGLLLLTFGGDRLVLASSRISKHWGVSPVFIGALVVGMGTSAPELLVSVIASAQGGLDLAVGNVIGSNVANVSLVLGASALLMPITGGSRVLRREGVLMFLGVFAMAILCWDGALTVGEGVALLVGLVISVSLLIHWARTDKTAKRELEAKMAELEQDCSASETCRPAIELLFGAGSIVAVLIGAKLLVHGAQTVALELGFSEAFIGLTLVAVGTSLPELATALAAAVRRENDLLVGNVVGSNLFNSFAVLGAAGVVGGAPFTADFRSVLIGMILICTVAGIFTRTGDRVIRLEGIALLLFYGVFIYLSFG